EDDAKKKIYSVWCKMPFGFGAEIDEETLNRLKALPDVLLVLPDFAFDVKLEKEGKAFNTMDYFVFYSIVYPSMPCALILVFVYVEFT
ncbi:hypothetical protein FRX31_027864, partial [Thalictrum thalictroides]